MMLRTKKMWIVIGLLAVLPLLGIGCYFDWPVAVECSLQYMGGYITEARNDFRVNPADGDYYSAPLAGGPAVAQLTAQVQGLFCDHEFEIPPGGLSLTEFYEFLAELREDGLDIRFREICDKTKVIVNIFNRDNPAEVLFSFNGTLLQFLLEPGVIIKMRNSRYLSAEIPLVFPTVAKATWWMGKFSIDQKHGFHGVHSDMYVIQGGLNRYIGENHHW